MKKQTKGKRGDSGLDKILGFGSKAVREKERIRVVVKKEKNRLRA